MNKLPFSINSWIYGNTPIEEIASGAGRIGADGLDISGEPDTIDIKAVKRALASNGLKAFCINGNYTEESRVFCHRSESMRKNAVEYGKKCVDMAAALESKLFLIVPSQVNANTYFVSRQEDWKRSVDSIREVAAYARERSITIVLECVNKYEVTLVRTLEDGKKMAEQIGLDNVRLIGDTFHMNLEEELGIHHAIRRIGSDWLAHLHLGDNTREVPGKGCIPWKEVLIALDDIGYDGALSFEPLPHRLSVDEIFAGALEPSELTSELGFSINYLKTIMQTI